MFKRMDLRIEFVSVTLLLLNLYFALNSTQLNLGPFIVGVFIYLLLSLIMFASLSPNYIFKENKTSVQYGNKTILSEDQKEFYLKEAYNFSSLFKFSVILIPTLIYFLEFLGIKNNIVGILIVVILMSAAFYMIFRMQKSIIKANGYLNISSKSALNYSFIYNNPDDKRVVVDKPFGIGTTVNIATKQGRIILIVILAIPITILSVIFIVLSISGKL